MNKPRQVKTVYYQACTLRRILISLCTFVNRKTCTQSLSAFNYIFDIIAVADHNLRLIKSQQKTGPMSRHDKIITSVSESIYILSVFLILCKFRTPFVYFKRIYPKIWVGAAARESGLTNLQILCKPVWPD